MASKPTSGNGGMASDVKTPANTAATPNTGEIKPKAFDAEGAVGKQFTEEGVVGGAAQAIGGPLDKDGAIGKQFTTAGSIGGSVQNALGGEKGGK